LWLPILYEQFGALGSALLGCGVLLCVRDLMLRYRAARDWQGFLAAPEIRNRLTVLLYVVAALAYLLLTVRMREVRYAFHVLPLLVLVGFAGWASVRCGPRARTLLVAALAVVVFAQVVPALRWTAFLTQKYNHPYIKAGRFVERRFSCDLRVAADWYSFVPPCFWNQSIVWGIDADVLESVRPDIIVMNEMTSGRWCWKAHGTLFEQRQFVKGTYDDAERVCDFLAYAFSEASPWRVAYEDDGIVVLARADLVSRAGPEPAQILPAQ